MAQGGQPLRIETGTTAKVEDLGSIFVKERTMNPLYMRVDRSGAAAGGVMLLGEVLVQHAFAECRIMPGDLLAFGPWFGRNGPIQQWFEMHFIPRNGCQ